MHGVAKQAATILKGRAGIYATLAKDHGEVASLLKQAIDARSEKREQLLEKIRVELLSHSRAEEETLYTALAEQTHASADTSRRFEEHETIEELLREAMTASTRGTQTGALTALQVAIESHVVEEENELFPQAIDTLPSGHETRLNERFKELKDRQKSILESDGAGWARGSIDSSL